MTISDSLEDYIEALYLEIEEKHVARVKDIARRLKVKNSSVTGALKSLAAKNLINYAPYEVVTLTPSGKDMARNVLKRHKILKNFFQNVLNVAESEADSAACSIEHAISTPLVERLAKFIEFVKDCPRGGEKWINGFIHYCQDDRENCEVCIKKCLNDFYDENDKTQEKKDGMTNKKFTMLSECGKSGFWRISNLKCRGETRKRFLAMGLTKGALIEIVKVAPLGDPIDIKVKGYHLSLRKDEAAKIEVETIESENKDPDGEK